MGKRRIGCINGSRRVLLMSALLLILSGCATNRGILAVGVNVPQNPASGQTVTIVRVTDMRQFQEAPKVASIPSLMNNEINDTSITSRAIARKRNSFGQALGDILLPEGKTVESLVKEALTRSLRESGYRVVDQASDVQGQTTPIEADIEQFWSWFTPGFWAVSLEFEARVTVTGNIEPFQNGELVRGYVKLHSQGAGTRAWRNTLNKGIEAFIQEAKRMLAGR